MQSYSLSADQLTLKAAARRFAEASLRPAAAKVEEDGVQFPSEILRQMGELGFLGLDVPSRFGGQEFDTLTCAAILEELAGGWFSSTIYAMNLATGPLIAAGSDTQKERYLPGICRGEMVPAFALTEAAGGSDAANIATNARRDGSDYVLRGQKIFITNAHRADVLIVFARTGAQESRGKGISIFLVDKGTKGLLIGQRFKTIAHRANPISEVVFDDCRIPGANLIGEEGAGFSYIQGDFAKIRAVYGSRCVGVAQAAIDYALQYAVERKQFNQIVASFQGIRFKVAELITKIEAARQLSYRAAVLADRSDPDATVAASMAKMFASSVAVEVTSEAMQIMGGHGYICDHPIERFYRESKLFQIGDGTSEVLKLLVSRFANRRASDREPARLN
jgi:alkylation response protein AidB-like acyl-CoA dehydrogenase